MAPGAKDGRLSLVLTKRARPRRIEAPSESLGISESAGGRQVSGSNIDDVGRPAWTGRCCSVLSVRQAVEMRARARIAAGDFISRRYYRPDTEPERMPLVPSIGSTQYRSPS